MSSVGTKLRVALVQADAAWHDPAANRERLEGLIETIETPVDLVVLPEMFSTGFTMCSAAMAETMDGETVTWLRAQAARRGVTITGSVVIEDGQRWFNRHLWMPPNGRETVYDKRHLFRMAGEHEHYAPGMTRVVVERGPWRIRLCVCYDLRFPVWLRARKDYDVLLCVANWPAARQSAWTALLRARAIENQCYAVGVNRVGVDGNDVVYRGGSAVFDGEGAALAEAGDESGILSVTLDLDGLREYRERFPAWRDADAFEVAP